MFFIPSRKFIKFLLWMVFLFFISIVIFTLTMDLNSFKKEIESFASKTLQEKIGIHGDIRFGVSNWLPSLVFYDVKVGESGKSSVIVTDRLEVALPLIRPSKDNPLSFFLNLQNLKIDGKPLGDYDMPIVFKKNGIEIPNLEGVLGEGSLTGTLRYTDNHLHIEAQLQDADYHNVVESAEGGDIRGDILLTAKGETAQQIFSSMNGHILLVGGEGEISGRAINFWGGELLSALFTANKDTTKIKCTVLDFKVVNGVARSRATVFDAKDVTVFGEGKIDIARNYVDMRFTPTPKSKAIVNLSAPMLVQGKFGEIKVIPDPVGTAKKMGTLFLGAVNPAVALGAYFLQETSDNPCEQYLKKRAE